MARKIVIIGGGIAGLSTGCYGQMNGYDTEIFEMHTVAGGVCTGWTRKGFTFDGCLHFLVGSAPGNPTHRIWTELGALAGKRIHDHEVFCDVVALSGRRLTQYVDLDRLVNHLKAELPLSRRDQKRLDELAVDVRRWTKLSSVMGSAKPPARKPGIAGLLAKARGMWRIRAYLPMFSRFGRTVEAYAARFRHPDLRAFFELVMPIPGIPAMSLLMILPLLEKRQAGWPEGGSLGLARSIEKRYKDLGGVVHYGARVEEIIVRDGRARGIRLADGTEHYADEVVSAADGRGTLFGMLGGRYLTPELEKAYATLPLYTPFVQVSYGLRRHIPLSELPRLRTIRPADPLEIAGEKPPLLLVNNYSFDPTMAPPGMTALTVLYQSPWESWEGLREDRKAYAARKSAILASVTGWLEKSFPGIGEDIVVTDVATPLTTVRYTGNFHASYEGWRPSTASMGTTIQKRIPGLEGFAMVGQWTRPFAGLPTVAEDGRLIIQELCAQDGKTFVTTTPEAKAEQSVA